MGAVILRCNPRLHCHCGKHPHQSDRSRPEPQPLDLPGGSRKLLHTTETSQTGSPKLGASARIRIKVGTGTHAKEAAATSELANILRLENLEFGIQIRVTLIDKVGGVISIDGILRESGRYHRVPETQLQQYTTS